MHSVTNGTRLPLNHNSGGNRRAASTSGCRNNRNRRRRSEDPASATNGNGSSPSAVTGASGDGGRRSVSAQGQAGAGNHHRPTRIPLGRRSGGDGMESNEESVTASATRGRSKLPTCGSNGGVGHTTGNMIYNNNTVKTTSMLTSSSSSSNANHINSSTRNNNINNNVNHVQYICGDASSGAATTTTTTTNTTTPRRSVSRQGKPRARPALRVNEGINQNEEDLLSARASPPPLPSLIFSGRAGDGGQEDEDDTGAARLIGSDPDGEQFRCDPTSPQEAAVNGNSLDYHHLPSPVNPNNTSSLDQTHDLVINGNSGITDRATAAAAAAATSADTFFTSTTNTTADSLNGALLQDITSDTRHKNSPVEDRTSFGNSKIPDYLQGSPNTNSNTSGNIPLLASGYRGVGGRGLVPTTTEMNNCSSPSVVLYSNVSNSISNGVDGTSAHNLTNSVISNDIVNQRLCSSSSSFHAAVSNITTTVGGGGGGERGAASNDNSNNDRTNSVSCITSTSSYGSDKRHNNSFNGNVQLQQQQRSQQYHQQRFPQQQQYYQAINGHQQRQVDTNNIGVSHRTSRNYNMVYSRSVSGNNNTNWTEDQNRFSPTQGEQTMASGVQQRRLCAREQEAGVSVHADGELPSTPGHLVRRLKKPSVVSSGDGSSGSHSLGSSLHESLLLQRQETASNVDSNKISPVHRRNGSAWANYRQNMSADACNEAAAESTRLDDSFVRLPAVRKSPSFPQEMASSINSLSERDSEATAGTAEQSGLDLASGSDGAKSLTRNKDDENQRILSKLSNSAAGVSCVQNFDNCETIRGNLVSPVIGNPVLSPLRHEAHVSSKHVLSPHRHMGCVEQAVSEGGSSAGGRECPVEAASVASNGSSLNDFLDSAVDANDGGSSTGGAEFSSGQPTRPSSRNTGHQHQPVDEQQLRPDERDDQQQQEEEDEDESSNSGGSSNPLQQHIQQQILQHQQQYYQQQQQQKRHQSAGPVISNRSSRRSSHRLSRSASRSSGIPPPSGTAPSPLPGQQPPLTVLSAPALDNQAEIAAFIATLRKERSRLLQEIEGEESERCQYNSRLDALNQRLTSLAAQGLQQSAEARGVEGEIRRLREVGLHRLGSPGSASRRRHHRLHAINTIEKTIQRLHHLPVVDNHSTSSAYSAPGGVAAPEITTAPCPPNSRYWHSGRRNSSEYSQRQESVAAPYGRLTASDGCPTQSVTGQGYDNDTVGSGSTGTNTSGHPPVPPGHRRRLSDTSVTSGDLTSSLYSRSFASDSSELSTGELRKHLSTSQTFQNHCLEPSLSSRRYHLGSEYVPAVTSQLEYNNSKQENQPSPQSDYLHQLNSSAHTPYSDHPKHGVKHSQGDRQSPCSSTANGGTWYEHLPRSNQKPPLQYTRRPPLQREKGNQRLYYPSDASRAGYPPHFAGRGSSNKVVMDVANSQMLGGGSTADEVSDIPSSSSASMAHHSMEPDSLDSGMQIHHHSGTTEGIYTNGDSPHTYDDANGGHYNGHHGEDGTTITGDQEGSYGDGEEVPRLPSAIEAVLRGVWPFEKALWHSSPATVGLTHSNGTQAEPPGIMATSSVTSRRAQSQQQLLTNKVEMVYGLLSMFSSGDRAEMSKTLLAMSSSPDSCLALRQSGCLPLLIQLLHGGCEGGDVPSRETRLRASQALQNVVHANADEKRGRREARVLRLLEQIRSYSDYLFERLERTGAGQGPLLEDDMDRHPCPAMAAVMKLSFDEEHRLAMCTLGGLHAIAELVKRDHEAHGATTPDNFCITLRRYAGMALTNLTFGAGSNKALVCSFGGFLKSLVAQLNSPSQDLRQVTSSVIRNLSWRADSSSKQALREAEAVGGLMSAALTASKEATLKVILSAVWNLSAHCSVNKAEICAVEGALAFICTSLTYKSQSRTLAIVENAGGILRNISSHIAVREDLRQVLRDHSTLSVILSQLRSPSLTVVSNACGTLWNLSARCQQDQQALWDLGAVPMLRSLINSKHKMISMGSSAALKNLLQAKPEGASLSDSKHGLGLPTLQARRQKALEQELDPSLAETCDNIESSPRASPTNVGPENNFFGPGVGELAGLYGRPMYHSLDPRYGGVTNNGVMTESRDSVHSNHSTRSDNTHDRMQQLLGRQPNGSSNGHRPADLALRNVNRLSSEEVQEVQTDRNGMSNCSSSERLNGGERSNSAPNTSRTVHPSDPLYSLYNKYVAHNRGSANRKDSRHGKTSEEGSSKNSRGSESGSKHSSTSNLSNGDAKPTVKVDNFVSEATGESDNVDQPTDFSLRYSEEEDPNKRKGGKPIKRVKPNSEKCSGEDDEEPEEEYLGADDSVQTYFTEGTPLNFSTATSLTDLREQGGGGATGSKTGRLGTQQEVEEEEASTPLADGPGNDSGEEQKEEDEAGGRLSRFSSLSSISSGEISAGHEDELEEDSDLQELVLAEGGRVAAAAARAAQQQDDASPRQDEDTAANGQHDQDAEWSAGVTPLMFSRTTSLGSLSSFPHQAPLDDTGSVLSEFSRLASGAVSPSDLPDSPSQTMPPSPRRRTPQHPQPTNTQTGQYGSSLGVFNDAPQHFNEEGTPCILSRGTSLSSLTMDDTPPHHRHRAASQHGSTTSSSCQPPLASAKRVRGDGKDSSANTSNTPNSPAMPRQQQVAPLQAGPGGAGRGRSLTPRTSSIPRPQSLGQDYERSRSSDPHAALSPSGGGGGVRGRPKEKRHHGGDPDGEKLLAACINSGMPNRRSSEAKTPVSRSHSFVKSPRTPTLGAPPIPPPPPPPPPPRLMGDAEAWGISRVSNIPINTANLQVTTTTLNLQAQGGPGWGAGTGDTLRTYCTEDTPAILSQAGSISDLSQLSMEGGRASSSIAAPRRPLGPSHGLLLQGEHTDSSSDTEGILDRCIQAAMPKLRSIKGKPPPPRHSYGIPPSPRLVQPMVGGKPPSGSNPQSPSGTISPAPPTALPRRPSTTASPHYSPRHRPVPVARVSPAMKPPAPVERLSPPSDTAKTITNGLSNGKMIQDNEEEVKNWGEVEGTPIGFSTATSLSDLTVDSCEPDPPQVNKKPSNLPRADTPKRYATEGTPANFSRCDSLSSLSCEDESGQLTSRLAGPPPQRQLSKIPGQKNSSTTAAESDEVPQQFNVEDTPAMLSRRSSLSSIDGVACSEPTAAGKSSQQTPGEASGPCNFGVEGTPVCFSRNSSLSSLSVESYPEETTPSEQALLQHCINQGMPRREQRLSRGSTSRGNKRGKSGSRIPGVTQSPGRSPARSPARNIPGVAMQRLQLVPITASGSSEAGGSNTEAESSKLSTDIEQSEKSQMEATSTPYLEEDLSLIDDITEVTEPVSDVTTAPIAEVLATRKSSNGRTNACALAASTTSAGGASSSPEEKHSSGDETRGSSGRGGGGADKGSWGSGHGIGSDVSMTDSMIVATEALRVARAVEVQGQDGRSSDDASIMSQSITSEGLLENIPAPSAMESVMSLSNSLNDDQQRSQHQLQRKSIECRHTRKVPTMVRRALGDQEMSEVNGTNGGSLASSCHSNLDNVVPPSFMEADDMESSMISVASITSEVAESRHSPPSMTSSIPSEAMAAIEAPAQQLARMFMREARQQASSMTLTAGDDTSTCQEVTELDRDETLGPHDTTTDTDLAVDDMPPDIPDLPQDSPLHRARNSPQVTPSMLRKAVHNNDRFRTFTKGEKTVSPQVSVEGTSRSDGSSKPSVSQRSNLTPKQRRAEQAERFRTRIISTEDDQEPDTPTTPTAENQMGSPQQRRSMREKRQTNPSRYQTRTIENGANGRQEDEGIVEFQDGAELDLTTEQLEALSQDANIVICTLNENREANTADLLHGLSQENILDIETLSLISSDDEDNTFDVSTPNSPAAPSRPRIVKPGEVSHASFQQEEEEAAAGKGIRGRRKGLYPGARKAQAAVKPTQQPAVVRPVVPTAAAAFKPTPRVQQQPISQQSSITPPSQLQQPGSPKLPRATRTSELRLKAGRVGSSSSSSPASSAGSSPRMGATSRPRQPPPQTHVTAPVLKRQNTFTKEEEEQEQQQRQQQMSSRTGSKPRYRKDTVQPSPMMNARQISRTGEGASGQPKSCSLTRDARPPSANDMAEWNKDSKTGKVGKKDVTSRIASLWKKVEKAQSTSKPKENDARVWISKTKSKTTEPSSPPPLVRSSTYEKLTVGGESRSDSERNDSSKTKTRLGLKLSRLRGRDSKSSPPSEAGTPVDTRPQCLVSPSRSSGPSTPRGKMSLPGPGSRPQQSSSSSSGADGLAAMVSADGKRLSRLGSFIVVDGEEEAAAGAALGVAGSSAMRSPQSAVVAPFNYQPPGLCSSPAGSRSSSISSGSQRRPQGGDERGVPAATNASTRIPLPKSVVMNNNPRDDNGNAPFV